MWLLTNVLTVLVLVSLCSGLCHDVDTKACQSMVQQNPGLCDDPVLSTTACPKFCRKCSALVCYDCATSVRQYMDCNTTRTCQPGEQCILHELTSSRDGHHEYRMNCATLDMCDGADLLFGRRDLGERDIRTHCCTDDLCNYPTPTTAPYAGCDRDIEILIQDSTDSAPVPYILQFVKDVISHIKIGPYNNQVGLAIMDGGTHRILHLDSQNNQADLMSKLDGLRFHHRTDSIDFNAVTHFLSNDLELGRDHDGNTSAYKNSVIIIAQLEGYDPHSHHAPPHHPDNSQVDLSSVTVMNIGAGSIAKLTTLATDTRHVINVTDYTSLHQHLPLVLNLLCTN